jgi:DNA mismatch repair protein MutS
MASDAQLTPMMAQYRRIKSELPQDALLLFRLGDFYELFFEDAEAGAQLLNVALTKRGIIPMCGIPFHAATTYIGRLLKSGKKVAICDQVEEARPGQLVKREVTQILSPGTHFDERLLNAEQNNYLAAIAQTGKSYGLACVDLTTGDFKVTELSDELALLNELQRLRPAEIIFPREALAFQKMLGAEVDGNGSNGSKFSSKSGATGSANSYGWIVNGYDDWVFALETALFTLQEHFKVSSLDGFGLKSRPAAIGAAGSILHYLSQHLRRSIAHLTRISFYHRSDFLWLDYTTLRHLEVLEPLHHDAPRHACLFGAVNRTVTPMGARKLREWLTQPLTRELEINRRQQAVAQLMESGSGLEQLRTNLARVRDLERAIARLSSGSGNGRDLASMRIALEQIPLLRQALDLVASAGTNPRSAAPAHEFLPSDAEASREATGSSPPDLLESLASAILEMPELIELIQRAIVDEPPISIREGGLIRDGFDANLDELRSAMRDGKDWIAKLQQDEIAKTGIQSLKVRFNSVFGYYLEVTKSNLDKVPPQYIRKQTIANGERFITPELKDVEGKILGAEERGVKLEYEIFQRVREEVLGRMAEVQQIAGALAQVDVLACFAENARLFNYCRPQVGNEGVLHIHDGRHPVLDHSLTEERFVPNDTRLDQGTQIALITGPNMAGKSTYIRQVALLTLLVHTGAFIPAAEARIDCVDRIFTRIGASDDLSRGQSTFMVEMCETANILNNATAQSLVVLDEIGRGTSTFDGLSLAWSIIEHLHNQVGAKTLFATHYHELTELASRLPRVKNYNVAVREWHEQIVFLRKIVEGGTDKSYGIQVARLAGVPKPVLARAKEILRNLEESELTPEGQVRQPARRNHDREKLKHLRPAPQLDLFGG